METKRPYCVFTSQSHMLGAPLYDTILSNLVDLPIVEEFAGNSAGETRLSV
jgi:hypothetical protein